MRKIVAATIATLTLVLISSDGARAATAGRGGYSRSRSGGSGLHGGGGFTRGGGVHGGGGFARNGSVRNGGRFARGGAFRHGGEFGAGLVGGFGTGLLFGQGFGWDDPFWGSYPYDPYGDDYPPAPVDEAPPPADLGPPPGPAPQPNWYYCSNPQGYYPYIQTCNGPWQTVPSTGNGPSG